MGANARRRADAKTRRAATVASMLGSLSSSEFSRMMRPACSDCGSPAIVWATLGEVAAGPEPFGSQARDLLPVVGASADAWTCAACGGFGAFEQTLHSGFGD